MAILASFQLVTPAASYNILTNRKWFFGFYWPQQSFWIFIITWECYQLSEFTLKLAFINFPIFSMVYKPNQIILGYTSNGNTNNPSSNFNYLTWSTIRGERASQNLFNDNYSPIGPTGTEISRARFSLIFPIGDILSSIFRLLQKLLCLWFLPAK